MPDLLPAIYFELDSYRLDPKKLMGRHAAGFGFIRGYSKLYGSQTTKICSRDLTQLEQLKGFLQSNGATSQIDSFYLHQTAELIKSKLLYYPSPILPDMAWQRAAVGVASYGMFGLTHTICSEGPIDQIASMIDAPLADWDALVCTSTAAHAVVTELLSEKQAYAHWKYGSVDSIKLPLLPVIPLGVHVQDYDSTLEAKAVAREKLAINDDEVVFLFAGRLAFHAKAHPWPMYQALELAAQQSNKKIVLVEAGIYGNESVKKAYEEAFSSLAPHVRRIWVDGANFESYEYSWKAADVFVSLSDNIQETFGLTPLEAMAAGLPVVVSDWNGYKDTVRDGVDGFRVRTYQSAPGSADDLSHAFKVKQVNYDHYIGRMSMLTVIDVAQAAQVFNQLIDSPVLRQKLGQSGRERATLNYDWMKVIAQYQEVWQEQEARRMRAIQLGQNYRFEKKVFPDPTRLFASYPTGYLTGDHVIVLHKDSKSLFNKSINSPMFSFTKGWPAEASDLVVLLNALSKLGGSSAIKDLANQLSIDTQLVVRQALFLLKMGVIRVQQ